MTVNSEGKMHPTDSPVNIALTKIENAEGQCCKTFRLTEKGSYRSAAAAQIWAGTATPVSVTSLDDFLELRAGLKSNEALTYGVFVGDGPTPLVTQDKVEPGKIARDRAHFAFRKGAPGLMMLDHDIRPDTTPLDWHELDAIITKVFPAIGKVRRAWLPSSSAYIYTVDGRELIGRGGWRCYFVVDDAAAIPAVGAWLYNKLWAGGHGWIQVSKSGHLLDRSLVDASVWSGERLDFAAPPDLGEGLQRRLPDGVPVLLDGEEMLVSKPFAGTTINRDGKIKTAKKEKRGEAAHNTKRFAGTFPDSEQPAVMRAIKHGELCAEFKLLPLDKEPVTVGEILAKPAVWDGTRFADPLEPGYRGDKRIAWACLSPKDGQPYIFSHAHGGITYKLIDDLAHTVDDEPQFYERHGGTWRVKWTREGPTHVRLANFTARIDETLIEDDGAETRTYLAITARVDGRDKSFTVLASEFSSMAWAISHLGAGAILEPGMGNSDAMRAAIQTLSPDAGSIRTAYAHTGWRDHEGQKVYLHAGGCIGADGVVPGLKAEFAGNLSVLSGFRLPVPPEGESLKTAVRASIDLLDLGPYSLTVPLLGAVYRAPLGDAAFVPWLVGQTGQGKSVISALMQNHWGPDWKHTKLPGSWSSTGNALEALLFSAKDALVVIDDYIPPNASRAEAERMKAAAQRVIRGRRQPVGPPAHECQRPTEGREAAPLTAAGHRRGHARRRQHQRQNGDCRNQAR